jgi:hypothetical protein
MTRNLKALVLCAVCLLSLQSCAKTSGARNPDVPSEVITTRYVNGSPRTTFDLQYGRAVDSIFLFDSTGAVEARCKIDNPRYDRALHCSSDSALTFEIRDASNVVLSDIRYYTKVIWGRWTSQVDNVSRPAYLDALIWLGKEGEVKHAVCIRGENLKLDGIGSMIEEMEAWKFSKPESYQSVCHRVEFKLWR